MFDIPFKSAGGAALYMPSLVTNQSAAIGIKTASSTAVQASNAAFWTEMAIDHIFMGFSTVPLIAALDTSEQEIVNTSGEGVLTHVVTPCLTSAGTMTIRVTADGKLTTFISPTLTGADQSKFCIGNFLGWAGEGSLADSIGLGSANDHGFSGFVSRAHMPTPVQSIEDALIGIKFEKTLIVTVQGSVNISSTAELNKAVACYTNFIPEGL